MTGYMSLTVTLQDKQNSTFCRKTNTYVPHLGAPYFLSVLAAVTGNNLVR